MPQRKRRKKKKNNRKKRSDLSPSKAREILRDGSVHGKKLTEKQKGFFGARAGETKEKVKRIFS